MSTIAPPRLRIKFDEYPRFQVRLSLTTKLTVKRTPSKLQYSISPTPLKATAMPYDISIKKTFRSTKQGKVKTQRKKI